jgi:hypothetical protein
MAKSGVNRLKQSKKQSKMKVEVKDGIIRFPGNKSGKKKQKNSKRG